MLCKQQHVAHELWAEQAWSKIWRRNRQKFLWKQIRNIFQITEILASLSINQICIWIGVVYSNHLKHGMSFSIRYQYTMHQEGIWFKWFPELIENIYLNSLKWLVFVMMTHCVYQGREDNFQNWNVTIPLPCISWHIDLLNAPTKPVVISSGFPCLLGIVLVDTSVPTVAAVPTQINWYTKT